MQYRYFVAKRRITSPPFRQDDNWPWKEVRVFFVTPPYMVVAPWRSLGLKGKIKNGGEVEDRGFGAVCVCLFNKLWFCFFFLSFDLLWSFHIFSRCLIVLVLIALFFFSVLPRFCSSFHHLARSGYSKSSEYNNHLLTEIARPLFVSSNWMPMADNGFAVLHKNGKPYVWDFPVRTSFFLQIFQVEVVELRRLLQIKSKVSG